MQVEIWSDVVCPWCYLGKARFEQALEKFAHRDEVEVAYRSFELDPTADKDVTTPTVDMLAVKYGMSATQARDTQRQMEQRASDEGLTFVMADLRSGSTRDAHRLLHHAGTQGRQAELVDRLHRAYFSEQRSVFDIESLAALATEVGLDPAEVDAVLESNRYDAEVAQDAATARELGATGVPFFVIDRRYGIAGAQPADEILAALEQAWDETATA